MDDHIQPTDKQKALLEEASSGKVFIYCGDHMYFGPGDDQRSRPTPKCTKCWQVYWWHQLKDVAPSERGARLEEWTQLLHHINEEVEAGTFDYQPFKNIELKIERGN